MRTLALLLLLAVLLAAILITAVDCLHSDAPIGAALCLLCGVFFGSLCTRAIRAGSPRRIRIFSKPMRREVPPYLDISKAYLTRWH